MKTVNCNTNRLLRNVAIACACVCFPLAMQANTTAFDEAAVTAEVQTEVAQSSTTDAYKYEAEEMGRKQKQQKKRRRHRKISHVR